MTVIVKVVFNCRKSPGEGERVLPLTAYTWRFRPKEGTFCRLKPKGVGISLVEVYKRVGKAVRCVKGPKRADRRILWLWGSKKTSWFSECSPSPVGGKSRNQTMLVIVKE